MDILTTICRKYIDNPNYVFKSCGNYIVVLEKLDDTITNESRSNISDPMYATYRANKLRVVLIINKFDPSDIITHIEHIYYRKKMIYEKDKIVEVNDYDMELNKVCALGIYYFKRIEQAFYFELYKLNLHEYKYTGKYIEWFGNGNKLCEGEYLCGCAQGKWTYWFSNGNKESEGKIFGHSQTGIWTYWHENGNKKSEGEYLDDNKIGKWTYWHENGDIEYEEYLDDEKIENWDSWYMNGDMYREY